LDPTHNKPLPPNLFEFLLRARGFASTEILKLQPVPEAGQIRFEDAPKFVGAFNALFYGSQDYGIIARKSS
jgi:O-antigen chain-terminating methyltransferase